jgi:hypothetical protein
MSPTKAQLIAFAREVVNNAGVSFGENKIVKLVLRFMRNQRCTSGWTFFLFLTAQAQLSLAQKREALNDPEIARFIVAYPDPVGEDAVNNVLRERGW